MVSSIRISNTHTISRLFWREHAVPFQPFFSFLSPLFFFSFFFFLPRERDEKKLLRHREKWKMVGYNRTSYVGNPVVSPRPRCRGLQSDAVSSVTLIIAACVPTKITLFICPPCVSSAILLTYDTPPFLPLLLLPSPPPLIFFSLPTSLLLSSYPRPQRFFSQAPPFHRGGYIYEALILGPSKKAQLWSAVAKVWLLRNFLFFFFSFFYWLPMSLTMQYFIMESDRNWWNGFLMLVSRSGVFSFFFSKFGVKKV